ncbi:hypothetical protein RCL_jg21933.t1 [Rhizophagus clarus]|uniref:Uncharacterized protein n=1 Tax=Rhizophagus clarus TaxID=94130 RepID=A0A8H3R370_9GLOM|nr:hypothetical protein RCL_jg21933.t1 [Rhizophagus clarus]
MSFVSITKNNCILDIWHIGFLQNITIPKLLEQHAAGLIMNNRCSHEHIFLLLPNIPPTVIFIIPFITFIRWTSHC